MQTDLAINHQRWPPLPSGWNCGRNKILRTDDRQTFFPRTELELLARKAFKWARKLLSLVTNLLRATTFVVHVIRGSRTDGSAAKQQLGSNGVTGYVRHFSNAFSSFSGCILFTHNFFWWITRFGAVLTLKMNKVSEISWGFSSYRVSRPLLIDNETVYFGRDVNKSNA